MMQLSLHFPDVLVSAPQWLLHINKEPLSARTRRFCNPTAKRNLVPLPDALRALGDTYADGLGFALLPDDPFVGIDLDRCLAGDALATWADSVWRSLGSYTEVSPSGQGLHIITCGLWHADRHKVAVEGGAVEVYDSGRFFTMSGKRLPDAPLEVRPVQEALDALARRYFATDTPPMASGAEEAAGTGVSCLPDDRVLFLARRHRTMGSLFRALFDEGNLTHFADDHSRADFALAQHLAFWTNGDLAQMERLFSLSALSRREKWGRVDYRQRTFTAAIRAQKTFYAPERTEKSSPLASARRFLENLLAEGAVSAEEILRLAQEAGIAPATLHRAKVGVAESYRNGMAWEWRLCESASETAPRLSNCDMITLGVIGDGLKRRNPVSTPDVTTAQPKEERRTVTDAPKPTVSHSRADVTRRPLKGRRGAICPALQPYRDLMKAVRQEKVPPGAIFLPGNMIVVDPSESARLRYAEAQRHLRAGRPADEALAVLEAIRRFWLEPR